MGGAVSKDRTLIFMTSLARLTTASADCERVSQIRPLPKTLFRSIHDPLEPGFAGLEAYRDRLVEATDLAHRILNGAESLPKIAQSAACPQTFGIAHCLAHLIKSELLADPLTLDQLVNMIYTEDLRLYARNRALDRLTLKRYTLLKRLEAFGVFVEKASARDIRPVGSTPPFRALVALVCEGRKDISLESIRSPLRTRDVINARFDLIYIMRKVCGHSLTSIGQQINRDHSSVLSAIASHTARIFSEKASSADAGAADAGSAEALEKLCEKADEVGVQLHYDMQTRQL